MVAGEDPSLAALRASIIAAAGQAAPASAPIPRRRRPSPCSSRSRAPRRPRPAPRRPLRTHAAAPAATERCAEERRIAEERCELATRARAHADEAADALRLAQRSYDAREGIAAEAAARGDPRVVRAAKEEAQRAFRAASRAAIDADTVEAAARDWLREINRINAEAREAIAAATRERAAAAAIGATLERLSLEADAARIGAENAEAACVAARSAVAECDEREATDPGAYVLPALPALPAMPTDPTPRRCSGSPWRPGRPRVSSGCSAATGRR